MRTALFRLVGALVLFLPGCGMSNVYRFEVLPQSYRVLESNSPKSFRLVVADYVTHGPGNARDVAEAVFLTEEAPRRGENIQEIIVRTPASHVLGGGNIWADLGGVTDAMSDASPDKYRGDNKLPIFWIISINPPVIAESSDRVDRTKWAFYDGRYLILCRLPRLQDFSAKVVALYELEQFPPNPGGLSGNEEINWRKAVVAKTRRIQLAKPMPLSEIFNDQDFRKGDEAGTQIKK